MKTEINELNLLKIGFKKNYKDDEQGFYSLHLNEVFMLTISFKTMNISLSKKNLGHIIEFKNINTIKDIEKLIHIIK